MKEEYEVEVDWRGFELHPETPEGGMPITDFFPEERIDSMRKYIHNFAEKFGVYGMGEPNRLTNTRRVLAVAEYARDQGKLDAFRTVTMDAYWMHDKNLESEEEIREISQQADLDADAAVSVLNDPRYLERVEDLRKEAAQMGVTGIPTFFIGDECIVGCQPYEVLEEAVRKAKFD